MVVKQLPLGAWLVEARFGYMEQPDVPKALRACEPFGLVDRSAAGVIFPWPPCHTHVGAVVRCPSGSSAFSS